MRSKRKKNKNKRKIIKSWSIILLFLIFIVFCFLPFIFRKDNKTYLSGENLKNVALTPSPTPTSTPMPTATPTPTPVPLVGYCLRVPVLMYHHVQPQDQASAKGQAASSVDSGTFDQQIQYLSSQGYTFLTAKDLVNALVTKSQVPSKSVVITFDDGYLDNYQYAYPVLKKYNAKGTIMIITGLLGGSDYLSWDNVREMAGSGTIYLGDHTWSHYGIGYSGSEEKIHYEIVTAKQQLQERIGQTVDVFAYPYGPANDLSVGILRQEGFAGAFSTIFGDWQCDSFIMALHRRRVGNSSLANYGL